MNSRIPALIALVITSIVWSGTEADACCRKGHRRQQVCYSTPSPGYALPATYTCLNVATVTCSNGYSYTGTCPSGYRADVTVNCVNRTGSTNCVACPSPGQTTPGTNTIRYYFYYTTNMGNQVPVGYFASYSECVTTRYGYTQAGYNCSFCLSVSS